MVGLSGGSSTCSRCAAGSGGGWFACVGHARGRGKVSHLVQAESAARHALSKAWEIVGSFEDLDVSAEVTPWKRPDLGPWWTEWQGEWGALVRAKMDRAFRSAKDCADVAHWAEENHKVLVFTDDGITWTTGTGGSRRSGTSWRRCS